jgi:hypothetical protein
LAVARTLRTLRLLGREQLDWAAGETQFLVIGGLLVAACFFAGQNVNYRGIFLLPVVSGLVCLHRSVKDPEVRRFCGQMIAAVLFIMWEEFFRRALHAVISPVPGEGLSSRAEVFFWVGRELVWWWLVVGLAALVLSYLRRLNWRRRPAEPQHAPFPPRVDRPPKISTGLASSHCGAPSPDEASDFI